MEKIKEFYNSTAHKYDLRQNNLSARHLRKAEELLLRKFAKGRILDVGCGTGYHLAFLEKNRIGKELIGVDISKEMLKEAREKCNCELVEAPAEELPFPDNIFDTLICLHSTLNLLDNKKAIREMSRVLKRNELVILSVTSVWDKDYPPLRKKIISAKENVIKTMRLENHKITVNLFSKNNLIRNFEDSGFKFVCFKGIFIYQRPYWGRFEDFTRWQKIKLKLDDTFPFNRFDGAGAVYLAVFRKK